MKKLKLNQGKYTVVDDEDFEWLSRTKWWAAKYRRAFYVHGKRRVSTNNFKTLKIHIEIMKHHNLHKEGKQVDHINGDGLDNRKINLRMCTNSNNIKNRGLLSSNTSGYKGVTRVGKRWRARLTSNRKVMSFGCYKTKLEAAKAYNEAALKHHGEFARPNEV